MKSQKEHEKLKKEIDGRRKEINKGKILTHEEIWKESLNYIENNKQKR